MFVVYKDGQPYSEVTVEGNGSQTIYELPVGTYTIEENTGWSWRYTAQYGASAALTAQTPNGTIICTNTKNANQWLNGFSTVVRNIFGFKHYLDGDGIEPTERQQLRKRTCCFSGFSAYDGGPQENLRAAVNTNEKRNHEICFITVS